ncbi:hypothetical protein ACFL2Q_16200 [Thermodesulfobacteriota bacterium]
MTFRNRYDDLLSEDIAAKFDIRSDPRYRRLTEDSLNYVSLALSTPHFEQELSTYLADKFNHNSTVYDRAIDAVYNHTRVGGSILHHNLDGSHTWSGAMEALKERFPDDSEFEHALHATDHLLRDTTTPSGINPFLDPSDFRAAKDFLEEAFNIPSTKANDILNINAAELLGAAAATVALLLSFNEKQTDQLGEYFGRLGLSSYLAGNPALLMVSAVCFGKVCYDLWTGESVADALDGTLAGGLSAATFWVVAAQFTGPLFIGLAAGAACCFATNWCYKQVRSVVTYDFDDVLQSQFAGYRSYHKLIS